MNNDGKKLSVECCCKGGGDSGVPPTVAVIIPFYNGSRWVERAIKSVLAQTVPPDEFVIVNDGSREDEASALERLSEVYGFVVIHKENGGQGSARNAGVAVTKSDFVCFLDQDDFYLENHVEVLTENLPKRDPRLGFVYADLYIADGDGAVVFMSCVKEHSPSNPKRSLFDLLRADMFVLPSASIISRKAFEAVGGFDPQFMGYEDDDLFLRIFRAGYTNYYVDEPVTVWCIHGESTSYSIKMARSRFRYFEKLVGLYEDNEDRGLYFLRDLIAPRFGRAFVADALKAGLKRNPSRPEIVGFLKKYVDIICASKYMRWREKMRFRILSCVLSHGSPGVLKALWHARRIWSARN